MLPYCSTSASSAPTLAPAAAAVVVRSHSRFPSQRTCRYHLRESDPFPATSSRGHSSEEAEPLFSRETIRWKGRRNSNAGSPVSLVNTYTPTTPIFVSCFTPIVPVSLVGMGDKRFEAYRIASKVPEKRAHDWHQIPFFFLPVFHGRVITSSVTTAEAGLYDLDGSGKRQRTPQRTRNPAKKQCDPLGIDRRASWGRRKGASEATGQGPERGLEVKKKKKEQRGSQLMVVNGTGTAN